MTGDDLDQTRILSPEEAEEIVPSRGFKTWHLVVLIAIFASAVAIFAYGVVGAHPLVHHIGAGDAQIPVTGFRDDRGAGAGN